MPEQTSKPLSVWMQHTENSAVGYYRIWQPAKYLPKLGWEVSRLPDHALGQTLEEWEKSVKGHDMFVVQRADNPEMIALFLALRELYQMPVVYEIDDNLFDVSKSSPAYRYFYPGSPYIEVAKTMMGQVDAVTVTTPQLHEVYSQFNEHVYVLPNCQDPTFWQRARRTHNTPSKTVIGWAGGYTHYDDLKMIRRPLLRLLRRHKNVIFRWVGFKPDFFEKEIKEHHPQFEFIDTWSHVSRFPKFLGQTMDFDIGVAPLVDRPFNWGKSNIKWQEYSMLEIPTVASAIGPYLSIRHGETGFLASNEMQWENRLEELIAQPALRDQLGHAAKQEVLEHFNIRKEIIKWDTAYREIIERFQADLRRQGPALFRSRLPNSPD